jgi:hypothetical protein
VAHREVTVRWTITEPMRPRSPRCPHSPGPTACAGRHRHRPGPGRRTDRSQPAPRHLARRATTDPRRTRPAARHRKKPTDLENAPAGGTRSSPPTSIHGVPGTRPHRQAADPHSPARDKTVKANRMGRDQTLDGSRLTANVGPLVREIVHLVRPANIPPDTLTPTRFTPFGDGCGGG